MIDEVIFLRHGRTGFNLQRRLAHAYVMVTRSHYFHTR